MLPGQHYTRSITTCQAQLAAIGAINRNAIQLTGVQRLKPVDSGEARSRREMCGSLKRAAEMVADEDGSCFKSEQYGWPSELCLQVHRKETNRTPTLLAAGMQR